MWIQVRTMDGRETHRVDSLSKLTKVEGLRLRIHEVFGIEPHRQRLFYRGKQVQGAGRPWGPPVVGGGGAVPSWGRSAAAGGDTVTPRGPAQRSPPSRYGRARCPGALRGGGGAGAVPGFVCHLPPPPPFPPSSLGCEGPRVSAVAEVGAPDRAGRSDRSLWGCGTLTAAVLLRDAC